MNHAARFGRHALKCTRNGLSTAHTRNLNTVINFVPQQEVWVIERFGKFHRTAEAGIQLVVPFLEQIAYQQSLKEMAMDVPSQSGITSDNVTLSIDGVLYIKVVDPYSASYGIEDYIYAVSQLAQTTMRSEIGKLTLDKIFQEREALNLQIVAAINDAAEAWGVLCLRYEIKNIEIPESVKHAMQMQVEAERKKRAHILESEGNKTSTINIAEGEKQSVILKSEALRAEKINHAIGEAESMRLKADARAAAIEKIALAINTNNGDKAAGFAIAEQYMTAFKELAQESTTLLLPGDTHNPASMVAQAMTVYDRLQTSSSSRSPPAPTSSPGSSTPAPSSKSSPPVTPQTKPSSRLPDDVELLRDSPTSFKLPKQFVNVGQ
ncbi:hypothetical protein ACHWQZ_G009318 [Mnemiopsis leidyi]